MSKKILCLVMAAAMLIGVFAMTGCSLFESNGETTTDSRLPTTLSIVGITEESTTPEAVQAVEDAINKITVAKYETKIDLTLVTRDEYYKLISDRVNEAKYNSTVDAAISQYNKYAEKQAAEAERIASSLSTKKVGKWKRASMSIPAETVETRPIYTAEETTIDEGGIISIKYPDAASPIDIVMVSGKDMYDYFDNSGLLMSINSLITDGTSITSFQKLGQYIYPTYLNELKAVTGDVKAVPTNNLLAEYTYIAVKRDIADKYSFNIDTVNDYSDLSDFLAAVKKNEAVTPFADVPDALGIFYPFGEDSAIATYFDPIKGYSKEEGTTFSISNLFDIPQYTSHLALMSQYSDNGYFEGGQGFAVAAIKGDASVEEKYGDEYYLKVIQNPFVTEQSIFDGMMAVSSYTSSDSRSLEIIQAFSTETELKNLLQFGISGVNYSVNADGLTIKRLNSDYMMDTKLTGNVYMGYPEEGQTGNLWSYYKATNLDSALSPFLVYYLSEKSMEGQLGEILRRATLTAPLATLGYTYDEFVNLGNTLAGSNLIRELKNLYKEYLYDCLRAEGIKESALAGAYNNDSIRPLSWHVDKIVEKLTSEKYADIISSSGLTTLTQEKLASIMGVSYSGATKSLEAYRKSAGTYYTNIAYLRIMAKMLMFDGLDDAEIAKYDSMSDAEFEAALLRFVTENYIKENKLTDEKYIELVKTYICSSMTFTDSLGNSYSVSWNEINDEKDASSDFEAAGKALAEKYSELLAENYFDISSASSTPVAVAEKIHDLLYSKYLSENETTMSVFQQGIYEEMLSPYGLTKSEFDSLKNKDKTTYDSYVSKLKSKYKSVIVEKYSIEKYKEKGTYSLTSTEILSAILNYKIEEKTRIYHDMCDAAGISYAGFTAGKNHMETYIKYVNMMRTKNNYTLTTVYTQSEVNNFKYDEIQKIVYDIVYDVGYYTNEMVKLVGSSLSDYMNAKSNAVNYNNALKKLITYYSGEIKALGYDIDDFENKNPTDIEEVIYGIAEKECAEGKTAIEDVIRSVSEEYIKGISKADNITEYCAGASKALSENALFDSVWRTFNKALKAALLGEES